ncbi:SDR family oxidoreductase [Bacillus sp. AFS031507]|uniref:SDR family oxidoreductase n=1 Tax=Bacillus sp. AFS031507 TaxID=2033496 RepID=UPI0035A0517B
MNSASPGFVEPALTANGLQNERFVRAIEKNTALKRGAQPEEIAKVIAFAASHEAFYIQLPICLLMAAGCLNNAGKFY